MRDGTADKLARLREKRELAERANELVSARVEPPKPEPPAPAAKLEAEGDAEPAKKKPVKPSGVVVSVHLSKRTILLLQRLAGARRATAGGGKASVSAAIEALVERHRAELEAELDALEAELG